MLKKISIAVALAFASQAHAAPTFFDDFTPLTASAGVLPATQPIVFGNPYISQTIISNSLNNGLVYPVNNAGGDGAAPDMIAIDPSGRYIFMPLEQGPGGVLRIDTQDPNYNTRTTVIVAPNAATNQGFVRGDASVWVPWGGYLTGEENLTGTGAAVASGRLFEVTNPLTATAGTGNFVQRSIIPRVAHEGITFDNAKSMYFVDENLSGSIYKYVSANPNAVDGNGYFAAGQTFALKVGTGADEGTNSVLSGTSTWVAITDVNGLPLNGNADGRAGANAVGANGFNRPEDMELLNLANGDEALIFATTAGDNDSSALTGTGHVYLNNLTTNTLSLFADSNTIDLATGLAVGAGFQNPDNIAIDANGNVYIVEDRNGSTDDDIWFANDINHDGDLLDAGEGLKRWASNGINGSEFTGLVFDKNDPNVAYVNIQHPNGGNDLTLRLVATAPVPEPETYAMLLAGLAVVGGAARRLKQK